MRLVYDHGGGASPLVLFGSEPPSGPDGQGEVSVQVLQEFYVTITRKAAVQASPAVARQRVTALNIWRVHASVGADVVAAAELAERQRVSFWDAMILRRASQPSCATVWTEDLNDGKAVDGVVIRNTFA
ncbi:MAG: PIN domain-containing protein [Bifidobacteriaceae bacterium]|nr:PIN domain-containing protein [Bifidobacteriaceae bacterium]